MPNTTQKEFPSHFLLRPYSQIKCPSPRRPSLDKDHTYFNAEILFSARDLTSQFHDIQELLSFLTLNFFGLEGLVYSPKGADKRPHTQESEGRNRGLRTSASLILYEFSLFSQLIFPLSGLSLWNLLILLIYLV